MHYVYILELKMKSKKFYIGYTVDLRRRLKEHKGNKLCELVYYGSAWRSLRKRVSA